MQCTDVKHSSKVQGCIAENTGGTTDESEGIESIVNYSTAKW